LVLSVIFAAMIVNVAVAVLSSSCSGECPNDQYPV